MLYLTCILQKTILKRKSPTKGNLNYLRGKYLPYIRPFSIHRALT
jgi:hypothetical protein